MRQRGIQGKWEVRVVKYNCATEAAIVRFWGGVRWMLEVVERAERFEPMERFRGVVSTTRVSVRSGFLERTLGAARAVMW